PRGPRLGVATPAGGRRPAREARAAPAVTACGTLRGMDLGLCFDLDGTLGRYAGDFRAFAGLLRGQLMLQACDMNRFYDLLSVELRRDGPVTLERGLAAVLERLDQRVPADLPALAAEAVEAYAEDVRPLPGARELLERLDAAGVPMALLTNGPEDMQRAALACTGLQSLPERTVMIGDSPEADVRGALDYGLQAVLVGDAGRAGALGVPAVAGMAELDALLRTRYGV